MDRSKISGTGISPDLSLRCSEAVGCTCDVLPQLAALSELGDDIRWLQFTCSVGCVSSGSWHRLLALCIFFFLRDNLS